MNTVETSAIAQEIGHLSRALPMPERGGRHGRNFGVDVFFNHAAPIAAAIWARLCTPTVLLMRLPSWKYSSVGMFMTP